YGGRIPPDPGDRGATARDPAAARVGRPVDAADGTADPARRPGPQIPLPAYRLHTRRRGVRRPAQGRPRRTQAGHPYGHRGPGAPLRRPRLDPHHGARPPGAPDHRGARERRRRTRTAGDGASRTAPAHALDGRLAAADAADPPGPAAHPRAVHRDGHGGGLYDRLLRAYVRGGRAVDEVRLQFDAESEIVGLAGDLCRLREAAAGAGPGSDGFSRLTGLGPGIDDVWSEVVDRAVALRQLV